MRTNLTERERLKKKADFGRVFGSPHRAGCRGAKLVFAENDLDRNRFAVSLVRKYGNAVARNRSKRILKEIYRHRKHDIRKGFDIVIVLYPGDYDFRDRERQFSLLLERAGLVKDIPDAE